MNMLHSLAMSYRDLKSCITDLENHGHLVTIEDEVDPNLVMAEVQRQVYAARGPAVYFAKVKGSPFPAVSNLFGTVERSEFILRHSLSAVQTIVRCKADPTYPLKHPLGAVKVPLTAVKALPLPVRSAPVMAGETTIDQLPQIKSWPMDGGPFITLPQVYSESPKKPGVFKSNVGMYRVQLSGNDYQQNREIGLHYQIRRGIGIHHTEAIAKGEPLYVSIFVGGPPAHTFSAVMPMPEALPEVFFAGMLAKRHFRYKRWRNWLVSADADFCILGKIEAGQTKPEGPFGDHLGFYSLKHEFPVLQVEKVFHRQGAIWPFTVVGRPPQEDTSFGEMIHRITTPMVSVELPGVKALHAVDAAGVHPLLLALGSERYVPYQERRPQEILTQAHAILGFNQCSLAKYLMIAAHEDNLELSLSDTKAFLTHVIERARWQTDLHFHTQTTMDTLDYSSEELNAGSKLVVAVAGKSHRSLGTQASSLNSPAIFADIAFVQPGVLCFAGQAFSTYQNAAVEIEAFAKSLPDDLVKAFPLLVLCDDTRFTTQTENNFLWQTFTQSNPSHDVYGQGSFTRHKHWGCDGSLIIDARQKPHHAPPLREDAAAVSAAASILRRQPKLSQPMGDKL